MDAIVMDMAYATLRRSGYCVHMLASIYEIILKAYRDTEPGDKIRNSYRHESTEQIAVREVDSFSTKSLTYSRK